MRNERRIVDLERHGTRHRRGDLDHHILDRYSDRLTQGRGAGSCGLNVRHKTPRTWRAKEAKQDIAIQAAAFGLYREKVAAEYVQREGMGELENRLDDSHRQAWRPGSTRAIDQRVHKALIAP